MTNNKQQITNKLCPNEEKLADYLEGRLSNNEKTGIEDHISECEICLEELVTLKTLLHEENQPELETVPGTVIQSTVRLVTGRDSTQRTKLWENLTRSVRGLYQRLSDLFTSMQLGDLAYGTIRGSHKDVKDDLIRIIKTFKDLKTEIEIEKTDDDKAHIRIKLLKKPRGESVRITLKRGEREISSDLLTNKDYALFEDLPFGSYNLVLMQEGTELGSYPFKITNTQKE